MNNQVKGILSNILESNVNEDELYRAYFNRELWSFEEFSALMSGITHQRYLKLLDEKNTVLTKSDLNKIKYIHKIYKQLLKEAKLGTLKTIRIGENSLYWSVWRFIKWLAEKQLPVRKKFFYSLSLQHMELYLDEFQPAKTILKTFPQWHRKYHETFYQEHARTVVESRKKPMSFEEIYQDPHMEYIRRCFKDRNGNPVSYEKSTIMKGWLPRAFPQKRGRPKKPIK